LLLLFAVGTAAPACAQRVQIDEVPMYGGMDRSAIPALKEGDEKFIADVTEKFGSREKASGAWVDQGFRFYQQDKLDMAMHRFNQAWLLNPGNPEVYWGFASALTDQNKMCEALKMVELGQSKGALQPGFLPDAALIYTGCAIESKAASPELWDKYITRSDELFNQAIASPFVKKEYALFHWARAMYGRGDYAGAWEKVAQFKKETGKDFDERFVRSLRLKMPEPK
jgi:tetratricopeptide (TPR) repeat protein